MELKKYEFYLNFWLDENFCDFYNKSAKIFDTLSNLRNSNNSTPNTLAMKTLIAAAIVLSAFTLFASAGTNLYDTNNWYGYRSNDKTISFASTENSITISGLDDDSYVWGFLDSGITLNVGETLKFSGTANFESFNASAAFYFGVFNSGLNRTPITTSTSIVDNTWDMTGFFSGPKNKSTTSAVYSRFAPKPVSESGGAGFMNTGQGASYMAKPNLETALAVPVAETDYDFSLAISRTEAGYDVCVNDEQTVSFAADKSLTNPTFDTIGFKSPGKSITLKNLAIAVAPEPAMFGLLAGTLALVLAGTRRRRR